MKFTFPDFTLVPYTRFTQRGKFVVPKAKKYMDNQHFLSWGYKAVMMENNWPMLPPHTPLAVSFLVQRPDVYIFDLDNALKAALDAANEVVFPDDRYVTLVLRAEKRRGTPLLEIEFALAKK
jgi:Holliday junction resolvase RusA-like endonuclease